MVCCYIKYHKVERKNHQNPYKNHKFTEKGETLVFGGEFHHTKDSKNRVFMPSKLRENLGETFVIAKDVRVNCLKVYSLAGWEEYTAPARQHKDREFVERYMRFLHSSMAEVTPDSQGRVVVPQELVEYAGIERNLVVVGCGDYAEIWSETNYAKIKQEDTPDKMRMELARIGL